MITQYIDVAAKDVIPKFDPDSGALIGYMFRFPKTISFTEYQEKASSTAIYPKRFGIMYPALGLGSEAGEVAGKISKVYRDNNGEFTVEKIDAIGDEISDVLWFIAALCNDLGLDMGDLAQHNLNKLASRKARGVIGGSGDNR